MKCMDNQDFNLQLCLKFDKQGFQICRKLFNQKYLYIPVDIYEHSTDCSWVWMAESEDRPNIVGMCFEQRYLP